MVGEEKRISEWKRKDQAANKKSEGIQERPSWRQVTVSRKRRLTRRCKLSEKKKIRKGKKAASRSSGLGQETGGQWDLLKGRAAIWSRESGGKEKEEGSARGTKSVAPRSDLKRKHGRHSSEQRVTREAKDEANRE